MLLLRSPGFVARAGIAPRLIAVTDAARFGVAATVDLAERVCRRSTPGSVQIQLRDRELAARVRVDLGRRLAEIAHGAGHTIAVNDRADLAALLGADALHLGEASMSACDARAVLGPDIWISRAWHIEEDVAPPDDLAELDALVVAPAVAPRKGRPALGTRGIAGARSASAGVRLYALGGVDASNASSCLAAGADGIAAIGAVFETDPVPLLEALGIAAG